MIKKTGVEPKTKTKAERVKEPLSKREEEALLTEAESCSKAKGKNKRKTARAKAWRHRGVNPELQETSTQSNQDSIN